MVPTASWWPRLATTAAIPVGYHQVTAGNQSDWDGTNFVWSFNLTTPPQVTSVVPQPVNRQANGTLSQARGEIDVTSTRR